MCNPAAQLAIAVGSSMLQLQQKHDQAKAQNAWADEQGRLINQATVDNYAQLNRQGIEDRENATMEGDKLRQEMAARAASARVSAAGAGISGMSVDAMLLNLAGKGLEAGTTSEMNYARTVASRADQAAELQRRNLSEKSRLQRGNGVNGLDLMGAGLTIGGAYAQYKRQTAPGSPQATTGTSGGTL